MFQLLRLLQQLHLLCAHPQLHPLLLPEQPLLPECMPHHLLHQLPRQCLPPLPHSLPQLQLHPLPHLPNRTLLLQRALHRTVHQWDLSALQHELPHLPSLVHQLHLTIRLSRLQFPPLPLQLHMHSRLPRLFLQRSKHLRGLPRALPHVHFSPHM